MVAIAAIILIALVGLVAVMMNQNRKQALEPLTQSAPSQIVKSENETSQQPAGTESASNLKQNEVQITSLGFSPKEITVAAGTTVKFTNSDTRIHTVASTPHPIHTDLPGFESSSLAPSESYSFTFAKIGDWGYHDHLNPSIKGTVKVSR